MADTGSPTNIVTINVYLQKLEFLDILNVNMTEKWNRSIDKNHLNAQCAKVIGFETI